MARTVRLQYADALYHIVSRGDRGQIVFHDDDDRTLFLESLAQCCRRTGWLVHAFVLMPNHFHLLIQTPRANLVAGMKWLLGAYAIRHNTRHRLHGHLFAGRYRAQLISPSAGYAELVADYIHLNPARAKLFPPTQPLRSYPWSSLGRFLNPDEERPNWLVADHVLSAGETDPKRSAAELETRLERMRADGVEPEAFKDIRRGWCFGETEFRSRRLGELAVKAGPGHAGPEIAAAAELRAETLVSHALAQWNWTADELQSLPKGHPRKLELAMRLRAETSMTLRWIADRLRMGTSGHLSHLLYWQRRGMRPPKPAPKATPAPRSGSASKPERAPRPRRAVRSPAPRLLENPPPPAAVPERTEPFSFDPTFD